MPREELEEAFGSNVETSDVEREEVDAPGRSFAVGVVQILRSLDVSSPGISNSVHNALIGALLLTRGVLAIYHKEI